LHVVSDRDQSGHDEQFERHVLEVLACDLCADGLARFFRLKGRSGAGDQTTARVLRENNLTVDEILDSIKQRARQLAASVLVSSLTRPGTVADTYTYEGFGDIVAQTGSIVNEFLYSGERYDFSLSLCHLRARYYCHHRSILCPWDSLTA